MKLMPPLCAGYPSPRTRWKGLGADGAVAQSCKIPQTYITMHTQQYERIELTIHSVVIHPRPCSVVFGAAKCVGTLKPVLANPVYPKIVIGVKYQQEVTSTGQFSSSTLWHVHHNTLHHITLLCVALHHVKLHRAALCNVTLHLPVLSCFTLRCVTFR